MANFVFETENLGQFMRVIDDLKNLDGELVVLENRELTPFESNSLVKIEISATYEQILKTLSTTKNSKIPLETIRPLQ